MEDELVLTRTQVDQILSDIFRHPDEEVCGLIGGCEGVAKEIFPVTNSLHSATHFRMEPKEQVNALLDIEQNEWELIAIYHSHPHGPNDPSETDKAQYAYPGVYYLICDNSSTEDQLRCYKCVQDTWGEIPLRITENE